MDNAILQCCIELQETTENKTILVTMDVNLRVRAESIGLQTASYENQSVDFSKLMTGMLEYKVPDGEIDKFFADKKLAVEDDAGFYHNVYVTILEESGKTALGRYVKKDKIVKPLIVPKEGVMGIKPRNKEQSFVLDALLDDKIKIVSLVGQQGTGKAQPLDADVLTPNGYVKMGDISLGQLVSTPNGGSANVIGIFPQGVKEVFEVCFSDGTKTKTSGDHLWFTKTRLDRSNCKKSKRDSRGSVKSTIDIKNSLMYNGAKNHTIPITKPIEMPKKDLVIPPYSFGVLLGDGTFRSNLMIASDDEEIIESLKNDLSDFNITYKSKYDYSIISKNSPTNGHDIISAVNGKLQKIYNSIKDVVSDGYGNGPVYRSIVNKTVCRNGISWSYGDLKKHSDYKHSKFELYLRENDLWDKYSYEKHIPDDYKYSCIKDRLELLRGLMDTDGSVDTETGKNLEFSTTSERLAKDFCWLVNSLGGIAKLSSRTTSFIYKEEKKQGRLSYRIRINMPNEINPFRLSRKANLYKPRERYYPARFITNVVSVGFEEVQCILLDSDEHLYLTNDCIVTHNTLLASLIGLDSVLDGKYSRLTITRPIVVMGNDIGYLPGDAMEKLSPYMQPFYDNLEFILLGSGKKSGQVKQLKLKQNKNKFDKGNDTGMCKTYQDYIDDGLIKVEPLTYIRGRSLHNQFIILDESQNISVHELVTMLTRCGENTKIVITGDPAQIDTPYLDKNSCGLSIMVEKMHNHPIVAHITLSKGERSELANLTTERFEK
jgi:predicted ribonuclease YlaK